MTKPAVSQDALNNQLATRAGAEPSTAAPTLEDLFERMKPAIAQALPNQLTPERMLRIATTSIRTNPKLKICSAESLLGAVMQCAQLGLEPSVLGHAYLVPYKNKKKVGNQVVWVDECQFQIGYKGLLELARRTGQISSIMAHAVHEHDEFDYEYGINETLRHKPTDGDRGRVVRYYAYAKFKDGGYSFMVMSMQDIVNHRDKFSKAKEFGPWKDHFDEMAKKTVLKALMKYMPISVEFQKAAAQDETTKYFDRDVTDMGDVLDETNWTATDEEPEAIEVTGEGQSSLPLDE